MIPQLWALAPRPETILLGRVYGHSASKSEMGGGEREEWAERNSDASLRRLGSVCAQQPQTHARLTIPTQERMAVSLSWEEDATL